MKYFIALSFAALSLAGLSSANAQEKSTNSEAQETKVRVVEDKMADKEDMGDQSRMICRKIQDTGSRVRSRRVCATAAEWAAQKAQSRQEIERSQTQGYGRAGN
ncbi:hypothetical protein [Novosphingopyxis sp.]|uniref:hypothetical protein n=1 Tax=Novosphingopyxis sp. TaxID=2709690 RepID=UPI003B5C5B4E